MDCFYHDTPESVFIYVLEHWKKLISRTWFFCELIQKPVFLPFYNASHKELRCFADFFKKDRFFLKKIDYFEESVGTYTVKKAHAYLAFCWVCAILRMETSILATGTLLTSSRVFIYILCTGTLFQSVEGSLFHLPDEDIPLFSYQQRIAGKSHSRRG
jgi:hypothetical protein